MLTINILFTNKRINTLSLINVTALAATLIYGHLTATLQALYSLYTAHAISLD